MKKRGLTKFFIRFSITTTTEAEAWLKHFEGWYRNDMMNHAGELNDTEHEAILHYLVVDPVGIKPADTSDAMLYVAEQIMQVAPAPAATAATAPPPPHRTRSVTSATAAPAAAPASAAAAATTGTTIVNATQYRAP